MDYNITLIQPDTYNVKMDNVVKVEPPQESIVVKSTEEEQVIIPQDVLYNKVVVEKLELQTKEIEPSQSPQVVVADEGYDGLKQVNINAISDYKRPSDWLEIPEMDGTKDEIYILNGVVFNEPNKVKYTISGIGTIDWGDGTTETFNGTKQTIEHTYDYYVLANSSFSTHNNSKQALIDLFNSIAINPTTETTTYTRTLKLGSTLQGYLKDVYVKDSGELYTIILPTSDTEVDNTKIYYTRDDITGEYTQFTDTTFDADTYYYELKTATWNRYDICESTDDGAVLALTWVNETKGWTIT